MAQVVRLPTAMITVPFGPRKNTPELRASLRQASVKSVRDRLSDHSHATLKTWVLIGTELLGEQCRSQADGPKVFSSLFATRAADRNDQNRYPFSLCTAYQLISIARNQFFYHGKKSDRLPNNWRTLYLLSRLTEKRIEQLIDSGSIHPMMSRAEAGKLITKPTRSMKSEPIASAKRHLLSIKNGRDRIAAFVRLMRECKITFEQIKGASA